MCSYCLLCDFCKHASEAKRQSACTYYYSYDGTNHYRHYINQTFSMSKSKFELI